jgi:hypothetical protein
MSGKKMAIWIALIWFLSSVHPVKIIRIPANENDGNAIEGITSALVLFTALLYGKTYFALRKQARSMIGKKLQFVRSKVGMRPTKAF